MKRFKFYRQVGLFFILLSTFNGSLKADNKLRWVEVAQTALSTQIMFDFERPVECKPEVVKEESTLYLSFPGMNLETFGADNIFPHLQSLEKSGLLKTFDLSEQRDNARSVDLALQFHPHQTGQTRQKNKFLIKWSVLENPHRLIIDIYPKENLERLTNKDAVLLHAANDAVIYDVKPQSIEHKKKTQTARIVIDPGHGGSDTGAKGFLGLLEKDITLDVAKRVQAMLKQQGFNALLTRCTDKDISLADRAQLAHQLKADLFVSIHVNSSGSMDTPTWGVETFYFDGQALLPHNPNTKTFCFNFQPNNGLVNHLQQHMAHTIEHSKALALSIQNNILHSLGSENIATQDRGVKQEKFRVLLKSSVPAALIEVGFLTNRHEAYRLSQKPYRNIIARGISDGIQKFFVK